MQIKVYVIDFDMRALKRRAVTVIGPFLVFFGMGATVNAAPEPFAEKEKLSAAKMNKNFNELNARVGTLETKIVITKNNKKYSLGATYCGATGTFTGAGVGGYAGAKTKCESVGTCNNSPSAHMCTSDEVIRSAQMGITTTGGWVSAGIQAGTENVADCQAWTVTTGNKGQHWQNGVGNAPCDNGYPILCCD